MNILFKSATLTLAIGLISACTSYVPEASWYKDGVSKQSATDQLGYCRTDVNAENLPEEQAERVIAYCMKSEGYSYKTDSERKQYEKTKSELNQNIVFLDN
ncbi:hypothetical protein [Psychrobacter urativorans]|uniref:hypothetical protein n=1 Tax=Psychrobacter urativorans TaxID=45610 RepID=UPI00191B8819|nr:hypothetical protein [Psychrobacter urativorans]